MFSLCVVVAGAASQGSAQTQPAEKQATTGAASATKASFDRALLQPASLSAKAPEVYEVKFTTTKGGFVVKVTRAWAPQGADRFYNLVKNHFYDGASFFRVLPSFVVQFGLSAYPQVSQVWQSAVIKDDPVKQSNRRGFLTFAMAGPNTRTTQVFINLGGNARLDSMGFSPFGEVTEGMAVVEQLYSGYGEGAPQGRGPRQDLIESRGKAYLEKEFPRLDSIQSASIVSESAPQAPATKPGTAPAKKSSD